MIDILFSNLERHKLENKSTYEIRFRMRKTRNKNRPDMLDILQEKLFILIDSVSNHFAI